MATSEKKKKKVPASIMVVGTFQVAVGLWVIFNMAVLGRWDTVITGLAIGYFMLGAGLLAVMEWARFAGVIVHLMILFYGLLGVVYWGRSGFYAAMQTAITAAIVFTLTRPYIRAKFQRRENIST